MPPAAPPTLTRATAQHFETVDTLRGLSILAVILLHIQLRLYFGGVSLAPLMPVWLFHLLLRNGDNGVTIFFAVSGFLITYTSIRRFGSLAQMQPRIFYRIRFARIAPLLLLLLAVLSILHLAHADGFRINLKRATLPGALFAALTFHLNWYEAVHGYLPANWDILWSLSVEETFYLVFPLACTLLLGWKHGFKIFLAILIGFVVMGPFARSIWTASNGIWQNDSYLGGMDAIALGVLTALLAASPGVPRLAGVASPRTLAALRILGALLIFWIFLWPTWHWIRPTMRFLGKHCLDGTLLPIGACLVIFASVTFNRPGRRCTAPLRWFGSHSYEIYMTHEFLVVFGTKLYLSHRHGSIWLWVGAMVLATAPVGWLVARYFSEPMNRRLRGRLRAEILNQTCEEPKAYEEIMGISVAELCARYPVLYHMASYNSWPSIQEHGLLSSSALVQKFEVGIEERERLLTTQRLTGATLKHPEHGTATLRDQIPLPADRLRACLTGCDPAGWYALLNERVFFWLDRKRLHTLMSAKEYIGKPHVILFIDTKSLVSSYQGKIELAPMNTGTTLPFAHPRCRSTFSSMEKYPYKDRRKRSNYDAVVELTVLDKVSNVDQYVTRVEHALISKEGEYSTLEILYERTP